MDRVWLTTQTNRPFKDWSLNFKNQYIKGLFQRQKKSNKGDQAQSSNLVLRMGKRGEDVLKEENKSESQQSSDFGLITARLGLLFTRLAAMGTNVHVKEEDLKLIEDGQKYFSELLNTVETLQKGGNFESISEQLKSLSFVDNGPQKFESLGPVNELKNQAQNMIALTKRESLNSDSLKNLAKLFLTISSWTIESDTAKFFSKTNLNELKFIV